MPITLYIHEKLKQTVEQYILDNNPSIEHGGSFLGKGNELVVVRFVPNVSKTPRVAYVMPSNHRSFIEIDKKLMGLDFEVHFHTHPDHTIVSGADIKSARSRIDTKYNIVLIFDKDKRTFTWTVYSENEQQYLQVLNKDYEVFKDYFANSIGLRRMGEIFLTDNDDIIVENNLGKAILTVDKDTLTVYNYLKQKEDVWGVKIVKTEIARDLSLTKGRVDKAVGKIRKFNLVKEKNY